jgi:DNA gyrase/topoisomerase IV subunit A
MRRRRDRKPYSIEDAKLAISDAMWLIEAYLKKQAPHELGDLTKALHALAQGANVLKNLSEATAITESEQLQKELRDVLQAEPGELEA